MEDTVSEMRRTIRRLQIEQQQAALGLPSAGPGGFGVEVVSAPVRAPHRAPASVARGADVAETLDAEEPLPKEPPAEESPVPPVEATAGETHVEPGEEPPVVESPAQKPPEQKQTLTRAERALIKKLKNDNTVHLSRLGRTTYIVTAIAILALAIVVLPTDWKSPRAMMVAAAALVWVTLLLVSVIKRKSGGLVRMLIGEDGRFSTSGFQAWVWTVAVLWAFYYFSIFGYHKLITLGPVKGMKSLEGLTGDLNFDYLLLLGGPFAALIVSKQLKQSKVASEQVQSIEAEQARLIDVVSADSYRTDLVDTQYLLFNFAALAFFLSFIIADPTKLPDLPDSLIMLTSASALGFVGAKAIQRNAPAIVSAVKPIGAGSPTVGDILRITGLNLVPAGAEEVEKQLPVRIKFGTVETTPYVADKKPMSSAVARSAPQAPALDKDGVSRTAIDVIVPDIGTSDGLLRREVELRVVTAGGVETAPFPITIENPLPVAKIRYDPSTRKLSFSIDDEDATGSPLRVFFGNLASDKQPEWDGDRATVTIPAGVTGVTHIEIHAGARHFSLLFTMGD